MEEFAQNYGLFMFVVAFLLILAVGITFVLYFALDAAAMNAIVEWVNDIVWLSPGQKREGKHERKRPKS